MPLPKPFQQIDATRAEIRDPRGLLLIWAEPDPRATYYIGVDPTQGITGWRRNLSSKNDKSTDNAAIEVIKLGIRGAPDEHVAEYAAPVDAEDLAGVVNHLGRMYAGSHELGQAEAIIELTGGHGVICQRELLSRYGYQNLFIWKQLDGATVKRTMHIGWQATKDSNMALFSRCLRHIHNNRIIVRSSWLIEEFADCTSDWILGTLRAKWGRHDDRVRAFFLAIWAAHSWTTHEDAGTGPTQTEADGDHINPVALPMSVEEMDSWANDQMLRAVPD